MPTRFRRLTFRELLGCAAFGLLLGFESRPQVARTRPGFVAAEDFAPTALVTLIWLTITLVSYTALIWWKRW